VLYFFPKSFVIEPAAKQLEGVVKVKEVADLQSSFVNVLDCPLRFDEIIDSHLPKYATAEDLLRVRATILTGSV